MTSTAAETDYKKRREGGRSNVQPSAFLLYCRISGDFNQGSLSSLSLSLCFAIARSRKISLLFYFCLFFSVVHACQLAALDPTHRARSTILLLRETLVLSTITLYDGRLQLVAWTNKTLRHHRKEWLEMEIVENKSAKQTNKLCSIVPLQLHSCNHKRFTFFFIFYLFIVFFISPVL